MVGGRRGSGESVDKVSRDSDWEDGNVLETMMMMVVQCVNALTATELCT